jgi:hypothetical protein
MKTSLCFFLLICMLNGCRTAIPAWLQNPKAVYPESNYLVAIGEGDSRRGAENAAAANLARIFEAHIQSEERFSENTEETLKTFSHTVNYASDVNILSDQTLNNIQHAEAWLNPETGRMHAVAYLDRIATAAILREKIDAISSGIDFCRIQSRAADDPVHRYSLLRSALQLVVEKERLVSQLRIVHPRSISGVPLGYSVRQLSQECIEAAQQVRVSIHVHNDVNDQLAASLKKLVTQYGFTVGPPAELLLKGTLSIEDLPPKAQLYFVRYQFDLEIAMKTGEVILSMQENGREAHQTASSTRQRAIRTLQGAIERNGTIRLNRYFDQISPPSASRQTGRKP